MIVLPRERIIILLQLIFITTVIDGNVDVCFKIGENFDLENSANDEAFSSLFQKATNELETLIREYQSAASFNYSNFYINISHPAVTLRGNISDGWVIADGHNLRLFTILSDGFEVFNITISRVYINGTYNFSGYVGAPHLFDLYGHGQYYIQLTNFSVALMINEITNSSSLCFPMFIRVDVNDCENNFENIMNGDVDLDPLFNGALQSIFPEAIRIIFREYADILDPYIQEIVDSLLNSKKMEAVSNLLYRFSVKKFSV